MFFGKKKSIYVDLSSYFTNDKRVLRKLGIERGKPRTTAQALLWVLLYGGEDKADGGSVTMKGGWPTKDGLYSSATKHYNSMRGVCLDKKMRGIFVKI